MVATRLNPARIILTAAAAVVGLTALGFALGSLIPGLALSARPHATLMGNVGDALVILAINLRALALPFALWRLRFHTENYSRRLGDLLMLGLVAFNTLEVGIELGRWRGALLPYVPQLPLEWAALAASAATWLILRHGTASTRRLATLAIATGLLTIAAAAVETWCTPHRAARVSIASHVKVTAGTLRLVGDGGCLRSGFCADPAMPLQGRKLPSPRSARFRSAGLSALTGLIATNDPHKEGSHAHHHR